MLEGNGNMGFLAGKGVDYKKEWLEAQDNCFLLQYYRQPELPGYLQQLALDVNDIFIFNQAWSGF